MTDHGRIDQQVQRLGRQRPERGQGECDHPGGTTFRHDASFFLPGSGSREEETGAGQYG
jgi:hypothetical protein